MRLFHIINDVSRKFVEKHVRAGRSPGTKLSSFQLCLLFKISYIKGVSSYNHGRNCTQLCF